jgi:invasion protein IalB
MYIHAEPGLMESSLPTAPGATPCTQRAGLDGRIGSTRMPGGPAVPYLVTINNDNLAAIYCSKYGRCLSVDCSIFCESVIVI